MNADRIWWIIKVVNYGTFYYFGTTEEAEEMRAHKEDWEGGKGTKRMCNTNETILAQMEIVETKRKQDEDYGMGMFDEREEQAYEQAMRDLQL